MSFNYANSCYISSKKFYFIFKSFWIKKIKTTILEIVDLSTVFYEFKLNLFYSDLPSPDPHLLINIFLFSRLQDGLKKRMEQLRRSVVEASEAVKEEREKNVALLQNIFPSAVAQKLWRGKSYLPWFSFPFSLSCT